MKKEHRFKQFLQHYFYIILPVTYISLYLCAFFYLEKNTAASYHIVHVKLDDYIPFCEIFVIPYFLWFAYITATLILFMFLDRTDYYKLCIMLGIGMTIFIIVSYLFPNAHQLRPQVFPRDNIFVRMVQSLYQVDTATNLFPSIHCYNSLAAHIAICKSTDLKDKKMIKYISFILCSSIIVSTVMIKQHSIFDVTTAFLMAGFLYYFVYGNERIKAFLYSLLM